MAANYMTSSSQGPDLFRVEETLSTNLIGGDEKMPGPFVLFQYAGDLREGAHTSIVKG